MGDINEIRAKRAEDLPDGVRYAIVTALANSSNGAFWGFTDMADVKSHADIIKADKNLAARKIQNAVLIEVNPQYLIDCCNIIDKRTFTDKDIRRMQECIKKAAIDFEKFLISKAVKGESQKPIRVGIYCTNDVTSIRCDGNLYPAFRVNMATAVNLLDKWGYAIAVGVGLTPAGQLRNNFKEIFASSLLSASKTGIFIDIACMYKPEQIKAKKAQLGIK